MVSGNCGNGDRCSILTRELFFPCDTSVAMLPRYRKKGFVQLAVAAAMTALLVFLIVRREKPHVSDGYAVVSLFLFIGCWVMWMLASLTLAKAKGYDVRTSEGLFAGLLVLGFCFMPVMMIAFPVVVLFGLKDKTRGRATHRR